MSGGNRHLFQGPTRHYWWLIARGAPATGSAAPVQSRGKWDFSMAAEGDKKKYAARNGGILMPRDTKLRPGPYYRFIDTNKYSRYGEAAIFGRPNSAGATGSWWLDQDSWTLISGTSKQHGLPLETAAMNFLAMPEEWGDRGRIVMANLRTPLWAWFGEGLRAQGTSGQYTPAQHARAIQLFIPGGFEEIRPCFDGVEVAYSRESHFR